MPEERCGTNLRCASVSLLAPPQLRAIWGHCGLRTMQQHNFYKNLLPCDITAGILQCF